MKRLTKEEIRELPLFQGVDPRDIEIVTNKVQAKNAKTELARHSLVGFDTESKPTFRKGEESSGPHLIQIACTTKTFIFPTRFPAVVEEIADILSDPGIQKVGFGLKEDISILFKRFGIRVINTVDLSTSVQRLFRLKQKVGARVAVAMLFNQRLSKSAQQSNWSIFPLADDQIRYAANDAYAALCIALKLEKSGQNSRSQIS